MGFLSDLFTGRPDDDGGEIVLDKIQAGDGKTSFLAELLGSPTTRQATSIHYEVRDGGPTARHGIDRGGRFGPERSASQRVARDLTPAEQAICDKAADDRGWFSGLFS